MTHRPPRLVFLTTAAERQMRRWITRRSGGHTDAPGKGHGIGAPAAGVLLYLADHPGATIEEVTAALQASPAGASGLLARMERADLVRRRTDPDELATVARWLEHVTRTLS